VFTYPPVHAWNRPGPTSSVTVFVHLVVLTIGPWPAGFDDNCTSQLRQYTSLLRKNDPLRLNVVELDVELGLNQSVYQEVSLPLDYLSREPTTRLFLYYGRGRSLP
jgi:hypothetical protein